MKCIQPEVGHRQALRSYAIPRRHFLLVCQAGLLKCLTALKNKQCPQRKTTKHAHDHAQRSKKRCHLLHAFPAVLVKFPNAIINICGNIGRSFRGGATKQGTFFFAHCSFVFTAFHRLSLFLNEYKSMLLLELLCFFVPLCIARSICGAHNCGPSAAALVAPVLNS